MARYAVVTEKDELVNTIIIDDPAGFEPGPGLRVVLEEDVPPHWRGRVHETQEPVSRVISPLAFRRRFTDAERGAITLAASRAMDAGHPRLQVWLDDLNAAGEISLDSLELRAGLDALVVANLVSPARMTELLK